jgi:AraC-like DNA-binding protein
MSHQVAVYFISGGGFALGLFSSAVLVARRGVLGQADRVLAALLLVCAVNAVHPMLGVLFPRLMPHDVFGVFEPTELMFGPLIYAYFRSLLFKPHHLRARLLLHALPMALSILVYVLASGYGGDQPAARLIPLVLWACLLVQMLAYLVPGWQLVHVYQAGLPDERSSTRGIDLGWLHWFSALVLALVLSTGAVMVLLAAGAASTLSRDYLALSVSAVTAILGFRGLLQVHEPAREVMEHREAVPSARPSVGPVKPPVDAAAAGVLQERLREYMEKERPFLDPELSLVSLAARLGVGRNQLSWVINNLEGKRFFDYINTFRVQAVVEMLKDPSRSGDKLISLAFDAGFNSKPTFNAVFKKHTGRPPSDFRV